MYKKYIKIEEDDSLHRYEYDELDIGDVFLSGHKNELYIRTKEGALSLMSYKTVQFTKGSDVVKYCKVTEADKLENLEKE